MYSISHLLRLVLPLSLLLAAPRAIAAELGDVAFAQAMKDLRHDARLMCVAAHPDDEDGATLAYHRYHYGVETHAVLATRGEGGQNEIGPELYEELAVIRTHEQLASSEAVGAQVHFLDLPEFGFSKTRDETLARWGEQETIGRIVQAIREVRPQVIITHHGRMLDHGHHQAVGYALQQAFDLAGDAGAFPEQIKRGLKPWQPQRLYIRAWEPGAESITIPISELDTLRGKTYAQMAAHALSLHASQGMDFFIERYLTGRPEAWYDLVKQFDYGPEFDTERMNDSAGPFFQGVVALYDRELSQLAQQEGGRDALKPALLEATRRESTTRGRAAEFDAQWRKANHAAAIACDLDVMAKASDTTVVSGQEVSVEAVFRDYRAQDFDTVSFWLEFSPGFRAAPMSPVSVPLQPDEDANATLQFTVPERTPLTLPHTEHVAQADFLAPQVTLVAQAQRIPEQVELRYPLYFDVAPSANVEVLTPAQIVPMGVTKTLRMDTRITAYSAVPQTVPLQYLSPGLSVTPPDASLLFNASDRAAVHSAYITLDAATPPGVHSVAALSPTLGRSDELQILVADLQVPEGLRVGLVDAYDNTLRWALDALGVPWTAIGPDDWAAESLDACTSIIVDMRAYRYRPDLVANNAALLDYVSRGGTAIVFYQKTYEWKPEYAPYPLEISRNRVTQEDAPVEVLVPDHPLLHTPHAITEQDWAGWVQERGLYFAERWDDAYTPLVAMSDTGEVIPPGSWLVAQHGNGHYVYSALVWYRQLRALNAGALRLFVNMIAYR